VAASTSGLDAHIADYISENELGLIVKVETAPIQFSALTHTTGALYTFTVWSTLHEAVSDLPFKTRVKAIYKLLVDGLPAAEPAYGFTVLPQSGSTELKLSIQNIEECAVIEQNSYSSAPGQVSQLDDSSKFRIKAWKLIAY
jgi:hypothetical protein